MSTQANNVILFPGITTVKNTPILTTEDIVACVVADFIDYAANNKERPVSLEDCDYDFAMFVESARSLLLRLDNKTHPFQKYSKLFFDKSKTGMISIKKSVE